MVVYILSVRADLEHVSSLQLKADADLTLSVRNPRDPTQVRDKIVVETSSVLENRGIIHTQNSNASVKQEPPSHFALKWDGAIDRATLRVLTVQDLEQQRQHGSSGKKGKQQHANKYNNSITDIKSSIQASDSGNFVPILALDCHDLEPYAFHPRGDEFTLTNTSGETFDNVDLSEGSWSQVDLASGTTAVKNFEAKFE